VHFKSLELVGFKSFAERTVIGFEPGITAIVGPNGCGKSNVSDAIRWVLGEQNARSLRGSLMEDLIFGGSAELEPMGMAEVTLTLGGAAGLMEDQFDEVTVSRRLFRSGESQCFLNNRPCRLKDIHRLFMDTGLGTQAYSFIQQGNIELILSSKPEDRRHLFDETAGISKYKAYKKEALGKLEHTDENLARLNDTLREVKRQIISIQRQAGKARRYKEFAEELRGLEVGFLLHKRQQFAEQMTPLERKRESLQETCLRLAQDIEKREARVREIRAELRRSEETHEDLQARRLELLRNMDELTGKISVSEQRIADTRSLSENAASEIEKMSQKVAVLESAIRERDHSLESLSEERSSCDQRLKGREQQLDETVTELGRCEAQSAKLSNRLLELIRQEAEMRSRLSSLAEASQRSRRVLADLQEQRKGMLLSLEQREEARHAAEKEKESFSSLLRDQKEGVAAIRLEMKKGEEELHNLRAEILQAEGAISRVASEHRFLVEAMEQHEGYVTGVRSVIEESGEKGSRLRGILGTVAEVIEVSAGFEESVESALENRLQWAITETAEDARAAAAFLTEKARGRATFLPLDAVEGSNGTPQASRRLCEEKLPGFRPILDLVSFDRRYENVMGYLLGNVILAPDFEHALTAAEQSDPGFTFVAPSGEKVENGSIITVGKTSTAALRLVNRKSRITSLVREEEAQRKRLEELRDREKHLLAVQNELAQKVETDVAVLSGTENLAGEAERNLLDLAAAIESLKDRERDVAARQTQAESELTQLEDQRKNLAQELNAVSTDRAEVENAISSSREEVETLQREVAAIKKDVAEIALAKASYDERIGNLQTDVEYMRGQLDLTRKEMESRASQIEHGITYVRALEDEMQESRGAITSLTQEKDRIAASIEQLDETRKGLADESAQADWEIKEKNDVVREHEKEIGELDINLAEIRFSINGIDERLMEEYELRHDDPHAFPLPEESCLEEVQSTIAELKRRLQAMGPVNLCAIEEHEALKKRYDFLLSQQSDLLEAKDSLLKAIAKLDRESKIIFREAFERIQEEFRNMFQRLFGGGRADLILVDESDILESGIEIIARPPGKKLQTISLLSGGERAMTAISLLFAIFKVKPSPFCILDEIDAPLDDSNIIRFAEVLRDFAQKSQFIVITHNKRTIATSDVLYGITMEEGGKSKVVSARLTRATEKAHARRAVLSPETAASAPASR
jgi:chromosome segregation protein